MVDRFNNSLREYIGTKQSSEKLDLASLNLIQTFVIFISLIIIIIMVLYSDFGGKISSDFKWILIITFIYGIINSAICSNLSTVDPRFQNRWIWIVPILAIIGLLKFKLHDKKKQS